MNLRTRTAFSISNFECLAIVQEAHLQGDEIVGRLSSEPVYSVDDPARMVERLANWGNTAQDILRFTQTHGLLLREHDSEEQYEPFRFKLGFWRGWQARHISLWQLQAQLERKPRSFGTVEHGELFLLDAGAGHSFRFNSLARLIDFWLHTLPNGSLKRCPSCNRYFVGQRQTYCGNRQCSEAARRQSKLRWWNEHGKQWRAKQTA
jgi:hypothetical protein